MNDIFKNLKHSNAMTQEEKARAYDEALKKAKDYFRANQKIGELEENDMLSDIFPELMESEKERIRKGLIALLKWTTKDAKDGDVLVASDGSIFLFAGVVDLGCKYYIALELEDETIQVNDNFEHCWESINGVTPATKEQRNLLFQKMKEAGYMWDEEKKELKKIEQNPAWSEEDETIADNIAWAIANDRIRPQDRDDYCDWLKSLKERKENKL